MKRALHVGVTADEIGRYVFIPGCVERAALIAEHLDHARLVAKNREFSTYTGELEGVPVSVSSTGIGGPSTAIMLEELLDLGAHTFVRIGSCASTSEISQIGDVIIPGASVRMEGTGDFYLPREFPAVPDYEVFSHMVQAARKLGYPFNTGVSITKDSFYTEVSPETKPVARELQHRWEAYEKGGATSTSMESSTIFLMGAALKFRSATVEINATAYNVYSNDDKDYPRGWEQRAIEVAVEGMRTLILSDLAKGKAV